MPVRSPRQRGALLDLWVLGVALTLTWPMFRSGQLLARDLIFTSRPPLRPEALGIGTAAPRAVPLDAVVAVLSAVLTGEVLGRVAILGGLLVAGMAAHRLIPATHGAVRAFVGGFAVWNPFVSERLALGQWALVLAYAALFPLLLIAPKVRTGERSALSLGPPLLMCALTPTGALLGGAMSVFASSRGWRPRPGAVVLACIVQVPWLMPILLGGAGGATTAPEGAMAFAARAERTGGAWWSLIGLGGIWDRHSMPSSRAGLLGHLTSLLVVLVLLWALGPRARSAREGPGVGGGTWVLGVLGLAVALLPTLAAGRALLEWGLPVVPGMGLLRDSQKWLAPFVVLVILQAGRTLDALERVVRERWPSVLWSLALAAAALPFVLLPDGGVRPWLTLSPAVAPQAVRDIAAAVDGSSERLITVPLRSYRRFAWTPHGLAVYDPASRWFDASVVTTDRLLVGGVSVPGEDSIAAAVESAWGLPDRNERLAALGVRWVVGYADDPAFDHVDASGWQLVVDRPEMRLWELRGWDRLNGSDGLPAGPHRGRTLLVMGVDGVVLVLLAGGWLGMRRRGRVSPRGVAPTR